MSSVKRRYESYLASLDPGEGSRGEGGKDPGPEPAFLESTGGQGGEAGGGLETRGLVLGLP